MPVKNQKTKRWIYTGVVCSLAATQVSWLISGCSTTETTPAAMPTLTAPEYVKVPHPGGFDVSDVTSLFVDPTAPKAEALQDCDASYKKLRTLTQSDDEIRQGTRELIKQDPVSYHWCFYGKIVELETAMKKLEYVDQKQKKVLDTYAFLVPVARGFMSEYRDSRYMRWAIRHYKHLSEWVFYRKLEQNPGMTKELVQVTNPFGLWREPASEKSVLDKYHLGKSATPTPSSAPMIFPPADQPETAAAPVAAPATPVEAKPAEAAPVVPTAPLTPDAPPAITDVE